MIGNLRAAIGLPPARFAALAALQELAVRLYFCDDTRAAVAADPVAAAIARGVPPDLAGALPDVTTAGFEAEVRGRRELLARELTPRFRQTWTLLLGGEPRPEVVATTAAFADFLASPYFLGNDRALPHPSGIGPGYEPVSKFFFWARLSPAAPAVLREPDGRYQLQLEFGRHLARQVACARDPFFTAVARGVYFVDPRDVDRLVSIGPDSRASRLPASARARLIAAGACDLGALLRRVA